MHVTKNNICLWHVLVVLTLTINIPNSTAQDGPEWMDYIIRDEITDPGYTESQKVLDPYSISTVRITMDPGDYSNLINNINSNEYLLADMSYESPNIPLQTIEHVGIRLRGAAARSSAKKSFKISFRAFGHDDREFFNLRKLNLNCDFQDPHLMRAKTCTDLFRLMGVDAARVVYAKLYINNEYRGLFANSEDIDKAFLRTRFDNNDGNLYKCPGGASMQNGAGGYELQTNEEFSDYSDILEFIDVLNNTPATSFKQEIEKVFDVDEMLMYVACNVLLGAWDDYWVLAKNYYFYHDLLTDQFNYIPHDFDGSLGTDWYHGNVAYGNVYTWSPNSGRPMVENLLAVPEYRDRYTHYLMLLCMWPFSLEAMEPEIDRTADMIRETLTNDPYWGWNPSDFDIAFDQAISQGNVKYGMKEYISLRRNSALEQLEEIGPFIKQLHRSPLLPTETDPVTISQLVVDRENVSQVKLVYEVGNSSEEIEMFDNGTGSDEKADDFIYTAQIPAQADSEYVRYYVEATNGAGKTSRYPASNGWASFSINYEPPEIAINEVLAQNDSTNHDKRGEYDDWFELYNPGDELVDLTGMYVSDNLSKPRKWRLGNMAIPAKGFLLLWADEDPEQGSDHVGFKLSGNGEELGLFDTDEKQNVSIDILKFGPQMIDVSYGRTQDGDDEWIFFNGPTPGRGNRDSTAAREDLLDITDFGGVVTESNDDSPAGESIENIIDNNDQTKYLTFQESTWVEYRHTEPVRATGYAIVSANDVPDRDPRNWEFQGWDQDGSKWITLHTVTNEPVWPQRFYKKEFSFSNDEIFSRYRLNISAGHGVNIIQMAELEIYKMISTAVDDVVESTIPATYALGQNYPNPFNPSTRIHFSIPKATNVKLSIYNVLGQHVKTLINQPLRAGVHHAEWDGTNENGSIVTNAVYFYRLRSDFGVKSMKMIMLK